MSISRRQFLTASVGLGALGLVGLPFSSRATSAAKPKVVIIGGGSGGATAVRYLAQLDPNLDLTLIERHEHYYTCYMSNEVLAGERKLEQIQFNYDGLRKTGAKVVIDTVTHIDLAAKTVKTQNATFAYDKLILSPGTDIKWDAIEGYTEAVAHDIPHAWKAGEQTQILRSQLEAMDDGGLVVISAPANPFRCPPGPYERASLIAQYLQRHKPKSKVLILDAKPSFAKQDLFVQGWEKLYGYGTEQSLIRWSGLEDQARVIAVDAKTRTVTTEFGEKIQAAVLNIIPPQQAGQLAIEASLTNDSGWCPVDFKTFESTLHPDVHIIGDACIAGAMPKSAYSANSQAKVAAAAVITTLRGITMPEPSYINTCYSLVGKDYGISVAAVYQVGQNEDGKTSIIAVKEAGGVSAKDAATDTRRLEALYAHGWYNNITQEMFG